MNISGLTFDWEKNRANLMRCKFVPRAEFQGRPVKGCVQEHIGQEFHLEILWHMDGSDPYPGEYALSTPSTCKPLVDSLGIAWVASGDVEVLEVFDEDGF